MLSNIIKSDNVNFEHTNFFELPDNSYSIVSSFYTAQFIRPPMRQNYFDRIYNILEWGGCLFLFEKIHHQMLDFKITAIKYIASSKKTMDSSQMKLFLRACL